MNRSLTSLRLQVFGLLLMSFGVIGFAGYWLLTDIHRSDEAAQAQQLARHIAAAISASVNHQRDLVRLATIGIDFDKIPGREQIRERRRLEEQIRAGIPQALAIRIVRPGQSIERSDADAPTLEFLKQTVETAIPAVSEFHDVGAESEHFDVYQPLIVGGKTQAHILVSISTASIKDLLSRADAAEYIELRRARQSEAPQAMTAFGDSGAASSTQPIVVALGNIPWAVAYWAAHDEIDMFGGNRVLFLVLLALATVTAIGTTLLLHATISYYVNHDIKILVRMFRDVREGSVRATYPMVLKEFAESYGYMREYGKKFIEEQQKLKGMGLIDHLSQLSNRRHFEARLKKLFKLASTQGPSTVLIIDVDRFKHVNDTHGHDAGDALIVAFSRELRKAVRQTDFLARLGGDEFCVIYPHTSLETAVTFADRLRKQLPRTVELTKGIVHNLRWTGGLSEILETDTKFDEVLWRADQALIKGKEAGRNITIIYDSTGSIMKHARTQ